MNRAMILPAAIAAGMHIAVLGFRTSPRADNPPPEKPEPIEWERFFVPPEVDEEKPIPSQSEDVGPPSPPSPTPPRGPEHFRPDIPDYSEITIVVKPSDYVPGDTTTLIPPGLGNGPGLPGTVIDAI